MKTKIAWLMAAVMAAAAPMSSVLASEDAAFIIEDVSDSESEVEEALMDESGSEVSALTQDEVTEAESKTALELETEAETATETEDDTVSLEIEDIMVVEISEIEETAAASDGIAVVTESGEETAINEENFPDSVFRSYVSETFDANGDDSLSAEEISAAKELYVSAYENSSSISSLDGIKFFTSMELLDCRYSELTDLDVSDCTTLITLYCDTNNLSDLDVSGCTALEWLDCSENNLDSLDISTCTALQYLFCSSNSLSTLNVEKIRY